MGKRRRARRPDSAERWYAVYGPNAGCFRGWAAASLACQGVSGGSCVAAEDEPHAAQLVAAWQQRQQQLQRIRTAGAGPSQGGQASRGEAPRGPRSPSCSGSSDGSDEVSRRSQRKRQRRLAADQAAAQVREAQALPPQQARAAERPDWAAAAAAAGWHPPQGQGQGGGSSGQQAPLPAAAQTHAFLASLQQPKPPPN